MSQSAPDQTRDRVSHASEFNPGRKSIARQLWRSFALLLAVLVVSGLVSSYLLLEIVDTVRQIIEVEDPLERAALEMEINAGEANQALFNYVTDPRPRHIDRFRDSNSDYLRFANKFTNLLAAGPDDTLGPLLIEIQRSYADLGDRIMNTAETRNAAVRTLRRWIKQIDDLIDGSLQRGLDPAAPDYTTKLHAALDMEINVDEAFGAIESYTHSPDPDLLTEIKDATDDFARFEAQYRATELSAAEKSVVDQVSGDFKDAIAVGDRVVALSDTLRESLAGFRGELERFDTVIDDRVQRIVRERKQTAYWHAERASWLALVIIVTMAMFVLIIAGLTTWVTTKKIVRSFSTLVTGLDAFAHGDFDHKIRLQSDDELGKLGDAFNHMVEQRRQAAAALDEKNRLLAELSSKLSKYLSPQVYDSIFRGEKDVVISTTRKKLTVLFSDIKDFTATTDDLEPEELASLLNDYLTEMSDIALGHGATIDKYVGDAMLLFFGDPTTQGVQQDAMACVRMAIDMQRRMVDLRARWKDLGRERPLHMRIGINTGYCNVGNFGSEERMDYTIVGGEVNLAARLEAAAPVDGIMLAHETYALVKDHIGADAQEPIHVKGFARPIRTYLVSGIFDDAPADRPYIHSDGDGMRLHIDLRKLDPHDRIEAAAELEEYARRLRASADEKS